MKLATTAAVALLITPWPICAQTNELHVGPVTLKVGMPRVTVEKLFKAEGYTLGGADRPDDPQVLALSNDKKTFASLVFDNGKLRSAELHRRSTAEIPESKVFALELLNVLSDQTEMGLEMASVKVTGRTFAAGGGGSTQRATISFAGGRFVSIDYFRSNDGKVEQVNIAEGIY